MRGDVAIGPVACARPQVVRGDVVAHVERALESFRELHGVRMVLPALNQVQPLVIGDGERVPLAEQLARIFLGKLALLARQQVHDLQPARGRYGQHLARIEQCETRAARIFEAPRFASGYRVDQPHDRPRRLQAQNSRRAAVGHHQSPRRDGDRGDQQVAQLLHVELFAVRRPERGRLVAVGGHDVNHVFVAKQRGVLRQVRALPTDFAGLRIEHRELAAAVEANVFGIGGGQHAALRRRIEQRVATGELVSRPQGLRHGDLRRAIIVGSAAGDFDRARPDHTAVERREEVHDVPVQHGQFVPGRNADRVFPLPRTVGGTQRQHPTVAVVRRADDFEPLPAFIDGEAVLVEIGFVAPAQEQLFDVVGQIIRAEAMDLEVHVAPIGTGIGVRIEQPGIPTALHVARCRLTAKNSRSGVPGGQSAVGGGRIVDQAALVQEFGQPQLGGGCGRIIGDSHLPQQQPLGAEKVLLDRELLNQSHYHRLGGRMKCVQLGKPFLHCPIEMENALRLAGKHHVDAGPFGGRQLLPDLEQTSGDPCVEVDGDVRIVRAGNHHSSAIRERQFLQRGKRVAVLADGQIAFGLEPSNQQPFVPGLREGREPLEGAVARGVIVTNRIGERLEERTAIRSGQKRRQMPRVDPVERLDGGARIVMQEGNFGPLDRGPFIVRIGRLPLGDLPLDRVALLEGRQPVGIEREHHAAIERKVAQRTATGQQLGRLHDAAAVQLDRAERAPPERQIKMPGRQHAAAAGRAQRFVERRGPLGLARVDRDRGHRRFADDDGRRLMQSGQVELVVAAGESPTQRARRQVEADQVRFLGGSVQDAIAGDHRGRRAPLPVQLGRLHHRVPLLPLAAFHLRSGRGIAMHPQHGVIEPIDAHQPVDGGRADQNAVG